jgi:hypothetical protein
MQLANANPNAKIEGADQLPGHANYFLGNDPAKWHTNVPTYAKVRYTNVYNGIDLVYYGNQRQLEYDFIVQPGSNPQAIQLHFAGAQKLKLAPNGDLEVLGKNGQIAFHKPEIYQEKAGQRQPIQGRFALEANNQVGFAIGSYDPSLSMVIDPVLAYSTYLGGAGSDQATAIAVDAEGDAYITGSTQSAKFPVAGTPYQSQDPDGTVGSAFVTKLNPEGSALVYSTYLGGTKNNCGSVPENATYPGDAGLAIAIDASGDAYVTGQACSSNFPVTSAAYQKVNQGTDNAFVTKLNPAGTALLYSTYLGGNNNDLGQGIAVDASGNAYIAGQTFSGNFPTTSGAFQTHFSDLSNAAFLAKLNPAGSALVYSTFIEDNYSDGAYAVAIDKSGDAYVTGYTFGGFPVTSDAYESTNPTNNQLAFVAKVNPAGSALLYGTYLGDPAGPNYGNLGTGIAVDSDGNAYVTGRTPDTGFPVTKGAFQTTDPEPSGTATAFVTKLNTETGALVYSTFLGGSQGSSYNGEQGNAIAVDAQGDAYVTGFSFSSNFPTTANAYQTKFKGTIANYANAFMTELNPAGSAEVYSTYLGGSPVTQSQGGDLGNGIAYSNGSVYLAGGTSSATFPVAGTPFQGKIAASAGNRNAFIARFEYPTPTSTTLVSDGSPEPVGAKITFTADVAGESTSGTPTGTVSFTIGSATPVVVALDDTGHAAYSTTTLAAGVHSVTATYSGDATHLASSSAALSETIYGPAASITAAATSSQNGTYGTPLPVALSVTVKDASGDLVPGATVTFTGTGLKFSSATATTNAAGVASVTATPTAVGTLTAKAAVAGVATPATFTETAAKAALTVTATSVSVAYNAAIPTLAYTITGYVNGDTAAVVTGKPTETTTALKGSQPGTYPITLGAGTLAATNYTFKLVNGTVTITALGVTAEPAGTESIAIAEATSGATVYYTTNGSTPTTASTVYKGPISVTATTTIKFIAVAPGYTPSAVRTIVVTVD